MKKSYIINESQFKYLIEGILVETPTVDYEFKTTNISHEKVFFNGARKFSPREGEYSEDTKNIRFFGPSNTKFEFDKNSVKFTKPDKNNPYNSLVPYVDLDVFEKKNPSLMKKLDPTPIITDGQIKLAYQSAVFDALQALYKETNWDSTSGRGPRERGGVINLYQVGDFAKEAGLENFEGGDWSILNYFDTNPKVREEIINEYQRVNNVSKITDLEHFKQWIVDNKEILFKDEETNNFLKKLVELNKRSYISGLKNEIKAFNFVKTFLSDSPNLELSSLNLPGSPKDRSGIDFSLLKDGKEIRTYQAKPLSNYFVNDERGREIHRVYSYNIENLKNINVDYFVFTSDGGKGAIIFKNQKGYFKIGSDERISVSGKKYKVDYIDFSYGPYKYDPNF